MDGLFHLNAVPVRGKTKPIERLLQRCIRNAAATGNGRNTLLEDQYLHSLSYYGFHGFVLVRVSPVDDKGRLYPYNASLIDTLWDETKRLMAMNYTILGHGQPGYADYYNPETFNAQVRIGTHLFSWDKVPHIRNLVVLHNSRPPKNA